MISQELGVQLFSRQEVDQADEFRGHEIAGHAEVDFTDAIKNNAGLAAEKQLQSYRAGHGEAGLGQLNNLRCAADVCLDGQSGMSAEVVIDQHLVLWPKTRD